MKEPDPHSLDRREFLVACGLSGGLLVGLPSSASLVRQEEASRSLNAFVEVLPDQGVRIGIPVPEIGQGVHTALAMIVAEELDADWSRVQVVQLPADPAFGGQVVGGSTSVSDHWEPLRAAGAAAREMLVLAAADRWSVPVEECRTERGVVVHRPSGRRLPYGDLVEAAVRSPLRPPPKLQDPAGFELVGRRLGRIDGPDIVRGRAVYGLDVRRPGMLYAVIERCPVHGGRVEEVDAAAARAVPGVVYVGEVAPTRVSGLYGAVRGGVAVVAKDSWSALQGRRALSIRWKEGANRTQGSNELSQRMRKLADESSGTVYRDEGDVEEALRRAPRRFTARYELPMLAHACMEPMCFTADVREDRCDAWGPTQVPRWLQDDVSRLLQLPRRAVHVHPTLEGGGFGRRLAYDYGMEAVLVSRAVSKPVKLLWTREDDLLFDCFRPPSLHHLEAGLDRDGALLAWKHHLVTAPLLEHIEGEGVTNPAIYDLRGGADVPFAVENLRFAHSSVRVGLQLGSWRSVSHSFNNFAVGCFVDELARGADRDPMEYLLDLLIGDRKEVRLPFPGSRGKEIWNLKRMRDVLAAVRRISEWKQGAPAGRGRGVAICRFKQTYVAHVAEVSVKEGEVRVERVFAAIDCGRAVNPDGIEAQVEGSVMDGVATVLEWGVEWEGGRVLPDNFDRYSLLRMRQAPEVITEIVPSERAPTGVGEPPYPSVAPAIANAIFDATGTRIRRLPIGSRVAVQRSARPGKRGG